MYQIQPLHLMDGSFKKERKLFSFYPLAYEDIELKKIIHKTVKDNVDSCYYYYYILKYKRVMKMVISMI